MDNPKPSLPQHITLENAKPTLDFLLNLQFSHPPGSLLFNAIDRFRLALTRVIAVQSLWIPGQERRTSDNSEEMRKADEEFLIVKALLEEGGYMPSAATQ